MSGSMWLWVLSFVNIAMASILILGIRAMLFAIGAFAAYVNGWPLAVLLFAGFVFSVFGILIAKGTNSLLPRRVGFIANGSTLALHSIILVVVATTLVWIPRQRFLIPQGYMGDIYVVHGVEDGEPEKRIFGEITYRIPQDGILRTQAPIIRGLTTTAYYYVRDGGALERIRYEWNTTISRAPENLANDKEIGIFFPRTGKYRGNDQKCFVEFLQFYVGTKAYLLSTYKPIDLGRYLNEHPSSCGALAN